MDNLEAITQSRAQRSCQSPHKSMSLHLGGPSGVFLGFSQCPGVPRSSNPVSRENELEEPDHQSDPFFDLTFVLTFDLTISGIPLIARECGGQVIFPKVSLGPGSTFILMALWARMEEGDLQIPQEGLLHGGWKAPFEHSMRLYSLSHQRGGKDRG